jgi:hypothetical protein
MIQPDIRLVDQRGSLKRLPGWFVGELLCREKAESLIDQWKKLVRSLGIPWSIAFKMGVTSVMPARPARWHSEYE